MKTRTSWRPDMVKALKDGSLITDSTGKQYCALQTGMRYDGPLDATLFDLPEGASVPVYTYVAVPS